MNKIRYNLSIRLKRPIKTHKSIKWIQFTYNRLNEIKIIRLFIWKEVNKKSFFQIIRIYKNKIRIRVINSIKYTIRSIIN